MALENLLRKNSDTLSRELDWLSAVLKTRFELYFQIECPYESIYDIPPPDLSADDSPYARIVRHYGFEPEERLILLLATAPHIAPQLLDLFFARNTVYDRGYTEFGGLRGKSHSGFLPTGETAVFVLAGQDLYHRFAAYELFQPDHPLIRYNLIQLEASESGEPRLSGALTISEEYLTYFTSGSSYKPEFSSRFPARLITTKLDWSDLVLEDYVLEEVLEIESWLEHSQTILDEWQLGRHIKAGYRALFHGPPGTGKTLTASLLGKSTGLDVYRIDLSQMVSKYIGETEKNMAGIFNQAENKNWILFFDEADALFGKRTATTDAKDRHANQEIAYLLQRVEDFPGVVILATNMKTNIDKAFARRFQAIIHFPMPGPKQRRKLWENAFRGKFRVEENVDFDALSHEYSIAGGAIINVLRYCALATLRRGSDVIRYEDIINGISREYAKEGKII